MFRTRSDAVQIMTVHTKQQSVDVRRALMNETRERKIWYEFCKFCMIDVDDLWCNVYETNRI